MEFQEILKRKREYYGRTEAAIEFAAEEFARQQVTITKDIPTIELSDEKGNSIYKYESYFIPSRGDMIANPNSDGHFCRVKERVCFPGKGIKVVLVIESITSDKGHHRTN